MNKVINKIKRGLIVSCQSAPTDPHYSEDYTLQMAKAAKWGGAAGLRLDGPRDILKIKQQVDLPIIGLWKVFDYDSEVFITPTMDEAIECIEAGADILAVDGTDREINGSKSYEKIPKIKDLYPEILITADIRNIHDADLAIKNGADFITPTLSRFDKDYKNINSANMKLLSKLVREFGKDKVIMESMVSTPEEAALSLYYGAVAVVVGNAITRPHIMTQKFVDTINGFPKERGLLYWEEVK